MKVPALLKNKYVCYALMALAALNVIGYVTVKAWECLALFALAGYSAHCYCKNVSVAILAALFVANFVFGCGRVKEGMEDMVGDGEHHVNEAKAHLGKALEAFTADRDMCKKSDNTNKVAADFQDDPESVPADERKTAAEKAAACVTALNACTDCVENNGVKTWEQQQQQQPST